MDPIQATLEALVALREASPRGATGSIPSNADVLADRLAQCFWRLPAPAQEDMRSLVDVEGGRTLLVFSYRLAVWAARTKDQNKLVSALVLHAIEDFQFDARENYRVFSILGDACQRAGMATSALHGLVEKAFAPSSLTHAAVAAAPAPLAAMGLTVSSLEGILHYVPSTP